MAFLRYFDINVINTLTCEDKELYHKLTNDIQKGSVFPAVRKGNLDFYFVGGKLLSLSKSGFMPRDENYERNYNQDTEGMDYYEKCKRQNENKFIDKSGKSKERQVLDRLNNSTFIPNHGKVVVIDIEITIHEDNSKKCDMLLLNIQTAQIMFIEGRLYQNDEMRIMQFKDSKGNPIILPPPVALLVCEYTQTLVTHKKVIEEQYANHIEIVNTLFNKNFPTEVSLVLPVKLLVYSHDAEHQSRENSTNIIIEYICRNNIMWNFENDYTKNIPSLEDIWNALCE